MYFTHPVPCSISCSVPPFLAFRGFANLRHGSRVPVTYFYTSLEPLNRQEYQNCSTNRTSNFEPHCMMFKELMEKRSSSHHSVSARKLSKLKMLKHCFWGSSQLKVDICFSQGILEPKPGDNRGITELEYILFKSTLASYSGSLRHRRG